MKKCCHELEPYCTHQTSFNHHKTKQNKNIIMKKVLLFASMIFAFAMANAQSYEVTTNGVPVTYGDTLSVNIVDGECSFVFAFMYNGSGQTQAVITTELMNESNISVISICAGTSCFGGGTTHPFNVTGGTMYPDSHVEFLIPDEPTDALFKVTIYSTNNESIHFSFYVKVLASNVGISTREMAEEATLSVYPNPATSIVNIKYDNDGEVVIYNTIGTMVKRVNVSRGVSSVDISDLPTGIYLYGLSDEGRKGLKKLVVR